MGSAVQGNILQFSLIQKQQPKVFYKIVILKNFAIFTGKQLFWSLFLIKLQAFSHAKKGFQHRCFPVNIVKFLRTPFLKNIFERLLQLIETESL